MEKVMISGSKYSGAVVFSIALAILFRLMPHYRTSNLMGT
jgi:hypothetical protein